VLTPGCLFAAGSRVLAVDLVLGSLKRGHCGAHGSGARDQLTSAKNRGEEIGVLAIDGSGVIAPVVGGRYQHPLVITQLVVGVDEGRLVRDDGVVLYGGRVR
jgi:hypothetical protein